MILLNGHSLKQAYRVPLEALSLQLKERDSTANMTPADMTGIDVNSWILDETNPGAGIVWRVKSITQAFNGSTTTVQLEHVIRILDDTIMFGEHGPAEITGNKDAKTCTAEQAIRYVLKHTSDWVLGTYSGGNVSNPYKFDGETLLDALETISDSLEDVWWSYDMSRYPFRLNITKAPSGVDSEMRAARNLKTISKTIDRSGMYTRFYPIGKNDLHITGDHEDRHTSEYGVIEKVEVESSIDNEDELKRWARERLKKHAKPTVTVDVEGLELADATGESIDRFQLGTVCRIPLPEYGTTIKEKIVTLNYPDKVRQPEIVKITMSNNRTDVTRIVADAIKGGSGGRGGRAGAKQDKDLWSAIIQTRTMIVIVVSDAKSDMYSKIEVTASHIRSEVSMSKSTIFSVIMQTATNIYIQVGNAKSDTYAKIEVTASSIRSEVQAAKSTLYSVIMQTATNIYIQVGNAKSDMYSKIEVTASSIRSEVETSKSTLYSTIMQTATNIYIQVGNAKSDMYSKIEVTASSIRSEVETSKSTLYSTIMQTATNIYTQVGNAKSDTYSKIEQTASDIRSEVSSSKSSLWTSIIQTSTSISTKVGKGEVISCINQTAEEITISASKINLSGYVKATDLTADWLSAKIADLTTVTMRAATITGSLYVSTGQQSQNVTAAIWDLWLVDNQDNTYTLKRKRMSDSAWVDVGTFNRAATVKVSGSWSGRTFTVSADDNGTTLPKSGIVYDGIVYDTQGQTTVSGKTVYHDFIVYADDGNGDAGAQIMKKSCGIDATAVYNNGWGGCYDDIGLNYSTNQSLNPGDQRVIYPAAKATPSASHSSIISKGITVSANTDANLVAGNIRTGVTIFGVTGTYEMPNLSVSGIARSADYASQSQQTLSTITSNGNYYYRIRIKDENKNTKFSYYWTLPVRVADSNPEQHHYQYALKCTDAVNEGGSVKYTFTMQSSTSFSKGTTYTFWR